MQKAFAGYRCFGCGAWQECATGVGATKPGSGEPARPTPSSLLVCIDCGDLATLDADETARPLSEAEAITLPPDVVALLARLENARQAVARRRGRNPFTRRTEEPA